MKTLAAGAAGAAIAAGYAVVLWLVVKAALARTRHAPVPLKVVWKREEESG